MTKKLDEGRFIIYGYAKAIEVGVPMRIDWQNAQYTVSNVLDILAHKHHLPAQTGETAKEAKERQDLNHSCGPNFGQQPFFGV